jgi:hypothetical protein
MIGFNKNVGLILGHAAATRLTVAAIDPLPFTAARVPASRGRTILPRDLTGRLAGFAYGALSANTSHSWSSTRPRL